MVNKRRAEGEKRMKFEVTKQSMTAFMRENGGALSEWFLDMMRVGVQVLLSVFFFKIVKLAFDDTLKREKNKDSMRFESLPLYNIP